jgi:hypothetical protein
MHQAIYERVNSLNQAVYETTKKLTDINVRSYEKLLQQQFALAGLCLEGGVRQLELAKDNKDFNGLAKSQSSITRQCSEKAHSVAKETMDILVETRGELDTWAKEGLSKIISPT